MKECSYKIKCEGESITVTFFEDELGLGRREILGEAFNMMSHVHRHAFHEIFFLWNGEMELVLEGEAKRYGDSVVVLPPSIEHYTVIDAERIFVIYVSFEDKSRLLDRFCEVTTIPISYDEKFYLEKLQSAGREAPEDRFHILSLLISELFRRLVTSERSKVTQSRSGEKYAFALGEYLEKHYMERIRLSDAALELHLCEKQVSRVIKKEYKCSFCDFVNQKRLSVAVMMLRYTNAPISEIARRAGFENENYFYKLFKKKYGKTPTEYRKEI